MALVHLPKFIGHDFVTELDEFRRRIIVMFTSFVDFQTKALTATFTVNPPENVMLVSASGGAVTVNLPDATQWKNLTLIVKKTDASGNAVTLDGFSTQTIDGASTVALSSQYAFRVIISDGLNWHVIGS